MSMFATIALALGLGLVAMLLAREILTVLLAGPPRRTREVRVGSLSRDATSPPIPKLIWTYWHCTPPSAFVQQCLANWQRMAPDHEIRQLDPATMLRWIPSAEVRADFQDLPPYRQADWLRIQLLARYGGIWIDASTLLTRDLAWVHDTQREQAVDYVGFFIDRYTTRPAQPLVENWFMAAPPASPFCRALAAEFDRALDAGTQAYLASLEAEGRRERVVQGLHDEAQRYLLMHVCAAALIDHAPQAYRLALRRAEDTAFAFHKALGWRKRHLFARLALTPAPRRVPMLVKLRGGDRDVVAANLARGRWIRGSLAARLLDLR